MDVTINLSPDLTPSLIAQAQAEGLSLELFLSRKVEALVQPTSAAAPPTPAPPSNSDEWEKGLDNWLDSFPARPLLSEEALKRETWYSDRW